MLTKAEYRKPRQSWARRLWPFPVIGRKPALRPENPRVGGSTPSQATSHQRLTGEPSGPLVLHLEQAAGGLLLLGAFLAPLPCAAQDRLETKPQSIAEPTRLRAAAVDAAWIGGAAALDLGLSRYALARCTGCYEANPLMRSVPAGVAMKVAATAAGVAWADQLRRRGDRRGARIVRWSLVGFQVALAANALAHAHR